MVEGSVLSRATVAMRARPAGRVLVALVALGLALRIAAAIGSWPTLPTLDDGYQLYAKTNPFLDPQHPAGYALIIALLGAVTRQLAVLIVVQHLLGITSALLLFAATRRATGSSWAGLVPAAMILLGADHVFLEHTVMSESWEVLASSAALYAAVRSFDQPSPWWRWPLLTGLILGAAVMIRTAALALLVVAVVALVVHRWPGRDRRWWRAPLTVAGTAALVLLAFAAANACFGPRFNLAPSPGWYLYGDVAQFADCKRFVSPPGTAVLCETRPRSQRPGNYYYLFDPQAPAPRHFGPFGTDDRVVGGWARRALLAQFGDFLGTAWTYLRGYWVPGSLPSRLRANDTGLDPQLDFTFANPLFVGEITASLEGYFDHFAVHRHNAVLRFLHAWQRVFRFGATALFVTTVLTLIGLVVGTRRSCAGVVLFGIGGLSLIAAVVVAGNYTGRYTVPMAGPLMAASAITVLEATRALKRRRPALNKRRSVRAPTDPDPVRPLQ